MQLVGSLGPLRVLEQVNEGSCLILGEGSEDWHELPKVLLLLLVVLILSFCEEVEFSDEGLELLALGVHSVEVLLTDEPLVVVLSHFFLWIKVNIGKLVIVHAVNFFEQLILFLSFFGLRELHPLGHVEGECEQSLSIGSFEFFPLCETLQGLHVLLTSVLEPAKQFIE